MKKVSPRVAFLIRNGWKAISAAGRVMSVPENVRECYWCDPNHPGRLYFIGEAMRIQGDRKILQGAGA
jgi:hypothetical protein